ncbi:MAG: hypothetical protein ACI4V3_05240 [Faecousia sp.]
MEPKTMQIGDKEYPITNYVITKEAGTVPLVDIPMIDDYKWHLSCLNSRLKNPEMYRTILGEDVEAVIAELRKTLARYDACGEVVA